MIAANVIACAIVFVWALWAILNPQVRDGVVGKFIFSCIAFSAMSVVFANTSGMTTPNGPATMLHVFMAALGLRHICMKHLWPRALKHFRCVMCPLHNRSNEEHF